MASAGLQISGTLSISVTAGAITGLLTSGSASANFFDDYVFTVRGGTGNGFFYPCFGGGEDDGASIIMSVGSIGAPPRNFCTVFRFAEHFTFGVPQIGWRRYEWISSTSDPLQGRGR